MTRKTWTPRSAGRATRGVIALAIAAFAPLACSNATDVQLLQIDGSGVLFGQAFLDFDASGTFTTGDQPIPGVDVVLVTSNSTEVVDLATTDSIGAFALFEVPVGTYRLSIDAAALGDSLEVAGSNDPITVALGDTSLVNLGASYPILTIEEMANATVGNQVFTSGIALNPRVNFDPTGQVHFAGESLFFRTMNLERSGFNVGDSVRLFGRVLMDNGSRILDSATPTVLVSQASLVTPVEATALEASTADGGSLDAALVRIRDAAITDTSTAVDGHFHFWVHEGTDSVEVLLRDFLGLNTSAIRPDTIVRMNQVLGLLTPFDDGSGNVRWRILPRGGTDVVLELKVADVSVTATLDTLQASLGDTIEVTVIASNAGPLSATLLEVRDTIPTQMTFVSSTQTTGSYDGATGIWDIGTLGVGVADTLRIEMEVTDGTPAVILNLAESLGLTFEVDPNAANNGVLLVLTIS